MSLYCVLCLHDVCCLSNAENVRVKLIFCLTIYNMKRRTSIVCAAVYQLTFNDSRQIIIRRKRAYAEQPCIMMMMIIIMQYRSVN